MQTRQYRALLSSAANVARVEAVRAAIEQAGGTLHVATPASGAGLTVVVLRLPADMPPDYLLPGLPFYPDDAR